MVTANEAEIPSLALGSLASHRRDSHISITMPQSRITPTLTGQECAAHKTDAQEGAQEGAQDRCLALCVYAYPNDDCLTDDGQEMSFEMSCASRPLARHQLRDVSCVCLWTCRPKTYLRECKPAQLTTSCPTFNWVKASRSFLDLIAVDWIRVALIVLRWSCCGEDSRR